MSCETRWGCRGEEGQGKATRGRSPTARVVHNPGRKMYKRATFTAGRIAGQHRSQGMAAWGSRPSIVARSTETSPLPTLVIRTAPHSGAACFSSSRGDCPWSGARGSSPEPGGSSAANGAPEPVGGSFETIPAVGPDEINKLGKYPLPPLLPALPDLRPLHRSIRGGFPHIRDVLPKLRKLYGDLVRIKTGGE